MRCAEMEACAALRDETIRCLPRRTQALVGSKRFELLICDEAHRLKVGWAGGGAAQALCSSSSVALESPTANRQTIDGQPL